MPLSPQEANQRAVDSVKGYTDHIDRGLALNQRSFSFEGTHRTILDSQIKLIVDHSIYYLSV